MIETKNGIFIMDNDQPIYVIGDIHGDYQCMIHCLVDLSSTCNITKIFDDVDFNTNGREYLEWKPLNTSVVVFCGDIIHRKRFSDHVLDDEASDVFLLLTLQRLKQEAINNGGNILIVSGNHEIMSILNPYDTTYVSDLNMQYNQKYFTNAKFIKKYIQSSYAWIKINDILIAHGGLCSDYLKYLDNYVTKNNESIKNISNDKTSYMIGGFQMESGDEIVEFVNNQYINYFINYNYKNQSTENKSIGYNLFVEHDIAHKKTHNIFWCREWGYSGIGCDKFRLMLKKVNCNKMIIAHCPQFLSPSTPQMINFECEDDNNLQYPSYNLARVDLGMSRSFEYNKPDKFLDYLSNNFNRKISLLQLTYFDKKLILNSLGVRTKKISCIQYLLLKHGTKIDDWIANNVKSNWLGFKFIKDLTDNPTSITDKFKCDDSNTNTMLCLLYPLYFNKPILDSITQYNKFIKTYTKKL